MDIYWEPANLGDHPSSTSNHFCCIQNATFSAEKAKKTPTRRDVSNCEHMKIIENH
jgi:hypothetical protein